MSPKPDPIDPELLAAALQPEPGEPTDYGKTPQMFRPPLSLKVAAQGCGAMIVLSLVLILDDISAKYLMPGSHASIPPTFTNLVGILLVSMIMGRSLRRDLVRDANSELQGRADSLASRLGVAKMPIRVLGGEPGATHLMAICARAQGIYVSERMLLQFTPGMLNFILAHELAHTKRTKRLSGPASLLIVFLVALPLAMFRRMDLEGFGWLQWSALILALIVIVVPIAWLAGRAMHNREFRCDTVALQATGDLGSALRVGRALLAIQPKGIKDPGTHPKPVQRIENLLRVAQAEGLLELWRARLGSTERA